MKRIILLLLSVLCINYVFAQSDNGTNISGDDVVWDDNGTDTLTLVVDIPSSFSDNNPIQINKDEVIYDLTGKKMETYDISTLPSGIYIRNGRKFMVK
ncbi:MAG: hypothetical protein J6W18_05795 [Bacteroidaceae bacterium]|nr:hypothetical protein [Bacteroidaceae bacterium]